MPYKDPDKQREAARLSARRRRAAKRAERAKAPPRFKPWPADPGGAVVKWARRTLRVPAGHPHAGKAMALPDYLAAFVGDALTHDESALVIGRKNAKSAAVAVLILAHLCGPLRRLGWRAGVASVNAAKAGELWRQAVDIAKASGLDIEAVKSPQKRLRTAAGEVEILPATDSAGAASSYDLAIIDEIGLLAEKHREFVASMRSSVSAKGGRFVSLSIQGPGPFVPEILGRRGAPGLAIHHYRAPDKCALDDEAAWHAANPGLACGIKSLDYMRAEAARAKSTPLDQAHFRAHDLNQPAQPGREMIVGLAEYLVNCDGERPPRAGPVSVGFDLGGSRSMCAACAYWPETGRAELWAALPSIPTLAERGEADGVGGRYQHLFERGELVVFPGTVTTPVAPFLATVADALAGETIAAAAADRYRQSEAEQALSDAGVAWPMTWRGTGTGKDGSADIRAFQRAVYLGDFKPGRSKLLEFAIGDSVLRHDGNGNPALDKAHSRGRIDALSAAVLAVGIAPRAQPSTFVHQPLRERIAA